MAKKKPATADGGKANKDQAQLAPAAPVEIEAHMPRLSKFQKYAMGRIARSQILNAPYNPRVISDESREGLKKVLRHLGLLEPLVWNKRTGNLVSGHQRISLLDALEGTPDYSLDLAIVDLDEAQEREANVAFNNPAIQGVFDFDSLLKMGEFEGFNWEGAGINEMQRQMMFGDGIFSADNAPEAVKIDLAVLQDISEQKRESKPAKKKRAQGVDDLDTTDMDLDGAAAMETDDERIERMRREKKEHREKATEREDTEFYATVVCRDRAQRERLMEVLGLDKDERYVNGETLIGRLEASE
jgi:hypothetical protein